MIVPILYFTGVGLLLTGFYVGRAAGRRGE